MTQRKTYSTRSAAIRAARNACKAALDSPYFEAYEGPDFEIGPTSGNRFYFNLRGPALDAERKI